MHYDSVKKSLIGIKNDIILHPFKTIGILCIMVLIIIGYNFINGFVSVYISKYTSSPISLEDNYYKPDSLKLNYRKYLEIKNSKDLYETDFIVYVYQPPGNFETKFRIINRIKDSECSQPKFKESSQEVTGVTASSTYIYFVKCISYSSIIDTKDLFNLST